MRALRRTPPNFFAAPFGLTGLAGCWQVLATLAGAPRVIADVLWLLAAVVWVVMLAGYTARALTTPGRLGMDLRDAVLSPFVSLIPIVALQLGVGLYPYLPQAARIIVYGAIVVIIGFGGWLTGQWIVGDLDQDKLHPGYLLPTVAGGLLASTAASVVGQPTLGRFCFGIGIVCWLMIGSLLLQRLFFRPSLPPALIPTLAIEAAPGPVAGLAWFALTPGPSIVAYVLAGYATLMVLVQFRLIPVYARTPFSPTFWAFSFSYAAVVLVALRWLQYTALPGRAALAWVLVLALTGLIAAIAIRSVRALAQGKYFPPP
ncbi:dicarboxylate transporter/tellurite-resistance protein TehA [Catellatospora methionotrophica]|uniref:Dicarboxylate transporter/tellurite-resistance protein TehA n=1 Tax=Catellatospora methionotrophica TaxID=121620 RepID=A0A8J3L8W6_9ACTN|nr:TDT family transporter [Catellatospora methionotrophica]GIG16538.1 dicarboxylate transporter/tellurite-resistance protein TehA [Catellatospora methionotrophica]